MVLLLGVYHILKLLLLLVLSSAECVTLDTRILTLVKNLNLNSRLDLSGSLSVLNALMRLHELLDLSGIHGGRLLACKRCLNNGRLDLSLDAGLPDHVFDLGLLLSGRGSDLSE